MNALVLAERATLGSLLLGDDPRHEVLGWLRASDFADPWHREVYRALRELAASDLSGPEAVRRALLDRLGPTRSCVVRVGQLMNASPVHADPSLYASMVLDASLRREIAGQGVLLRAGALSAVLDGSPRPMLAVAATVAGILDGAERRWQFATDPLAAQATSVDPLRLGAEPAGGPGRLRVSDQALAADRLLGAHRQLDAAWVAEHEAALIAVLVLRPSELAPVRAWLHPAALTNEVWRPIYTAVLRLADHGRRIDQVSVVWEVSRVQADIDPAEVIARVEGSFGMNPAYLARVVAADHLRIAADRAAVAVSLAAGDPALDLREVFGAARIHVSAVTAAARPLAIGGAEIRTPGLTHRQVLVQRRDRPGPLAVEGRTG